MWMSRLRKLRVDVRRFGTDDGGAVTVDWVVLTATVLLFVSVMISIVTEGTDNATADIARSLTANTR